jgi:hypothetical protein
VNALFRVNSTDDETFGIFSTTQKPAAKPQVGPPRGAMVRVSARG